MASVWTDWTYFECFPISMGAKFLTFWQKIIFFFDSHHRNIIINLYYLHRIFYPNKDVST